MSDLPDLMSDRKCGHACFSYCAVGATPLVFVFNRSRNIEPTEAQLEDYRRRRVIVEANGGYMNKSPYQCAGENPPFSKQEVNEMIAAVFRDNPDLVLDHHWNGLGCYSFSVGARIK